jgi:hypothetical protein
MKGGRNGELRLPAGLLPRRLLLDVEADVQHISVLNLVGLAFEALEAATSGLHV